MTFASLLLTAALLATDPGVAQTQDRPVDLSPDACARLGALTFAPASIGLPTTGGAVTAAEWVEAGGEGAAAHETHCRVSGIIRPVDPNAPNIRFQVALPRHWNSKLAMLGGGGYDGFIPNVAGNLLNTPAGALPPLSRGYAVFGSDGGHEGSMVDAGRFTLNDEAYRNWMGEALKKTRDVSVQVIQTAYGRPAERSYFLGSSTGGREGLSVAGLWPQDWDGVVALYPARDVTASYIGMLAASQVLAAPGAFVNTVERGALYRAALEACDTLDGAADQLISDVRGCRARFDPATATLEGAPLRCPGGLDTADICLSDAQLAALKRIDAGTPLAYASADGVARFPGYNILTADTGGVASPVQNGVAVRAIGLTPPARPLAPTNALAVHLADNHTRFAVTRDPSFDFLTFNVESPGPYAARLAELSAFDDMDRDLGGFAQRGGKVLILHGTDDLLTSPRLTENWVLRLRTTMGDAAVDRVVRFYEVPGFGHSQSSVFGAAWDQLTALEQWVEDGVDPAANQVVIDTTGKPGRTRPLCPYPSWARYDGAGDIDAAASFSCVTS